MENLQELKKKLQFLEYRVSNKNDDYDNETKNAVQSFQNDYGLDINGILNSKTLAAIEKAYKLKNKDEVLEVSAIAKSQERPKLSLNYNNPYVKELQEGLKKLGYLKGPTDSIFGKDTESAVKNFQRDNNLTADGVVGQKTWSTLDKLLANNNQIEKPIAPVPPSNIITPDIKEKPTLRIGSRGIEVVELEQSLLSLGYFIGNPNATFDEETEAAVIKFQRRYKLIDDGVVGPTTWAAIDDAFSAQPTAPITDSITLKEGSKGDEVKSLQQKLEILGLYDGVIDGNFGSETTEAVKAFQKLNGLTVDGVVGPRMWDVLNTKYNNLPINLPVVKEESTGDAVKILQEKLQQLGYYVGSVTGSFGYETTLSVKAFQKDNGIVADGVVGAKTWKTLYEATKVIIPTEPLPSGPKPTLKAGDKGEYVSQLQDELKKLMYYNGDISGFFDKRTLVAVQSFQDANKLTADGVVGRSTWYYLDSIYPPAVVCD